MSTKHIFITKDGPYSVTVAIPLNRATIVCNKDSESESWAKSENYDTGSEATYSLCRCGHSQARPFCDGTHATRGFRGREQPDSRPYALRARKYEGPNLDLLDDERLCVQARFCDRAGTVWRMIRRTDDPELRALAITEACNCPGGRLTAVSKDGTPLEPDLPEAISLVEDPENDFRGPLWVQGGIRIEDAQGEVYEIRNRVTLCRCGASTNMPYCDASHYHCSHMKGLDK